MNNPLATPDGGVGWNAASVDMPPLPSIQPGEDALSMAIAAVLPEMHAGLQTSVTATQAKEGMFSEKVGSAKGKYENADDQGGQAVGKLGSMLGQLSEMGQKAGQSAGGGGGGQSSMFSQLMEQAMKAAQGGGGSQQGGSGQGQGQGQGQGGQSPAGQPAGGGAPGGQPAGGQPGGQPGQPAGTPPGPTQQERDENAARQEEQRREAREHAAREEKAPASPAHKPPVEAAGPGDRQHAAGPAPVGPPQHPRPGSDDLARRV